MEVGFGKFGRIRRANKAICCRLSVDLRDKLLYLLLHHVLLQKLALSSLEAATLEKGFILSVPLLLKLPLLPRGILLETVSGVPELLVPLLQLC